MRVVPYQEENREFCCFASNRYGIANLLHFHWSTAKPTRGVDQSEDSSRAFLYLYNFLNSDLYNSEKILFNHIFNNLLLSFFLFWQLILNLVLNLCLNFTVFWSFWAVLSFKIIEGAFCLPRVRLTQHWVEKFVHFISPREEVQTLAASKCLWLNVHRF